MELEESLSFVGMKLVLVIIKVKYRIMTSYIQYKIQYKYNFSTNLDLTTPQDVDFLENLLSEFEEPTNLTEPIDTYFAKQRCQRLFPDSEDPIRERTMVALMVVKATQCWDHLFWSSDH